MIYLVDDNKEFCDSVIDSFAFEVKTFTNSDAALLQIVKDKPELVITDIFIPSYMSEYGKPLGFPGPDLIKVLMKLAPTLEIIAISGNSKDEIFSFFPTMKETLQHIKFFEKPLKDDFYVYVEQAVATAQKTTRLTP